MATAVVPPQTAGNLRIEAIGGLTDNSLSDLRLHFDVDAVAGERYYGALGVSTQFRQNNPLEVIAVDLLRQADDVTKTARPENITPGDNVTFEIVVKPNTLPEVLTYTISNALPDGLTYLEGSATATAGEIAVEADRLRWRGTLDPAPASNAVVIRYATQVAADVPFGAHFTSTAVSTTNNVGSVSVTTGTRITVGHLSYQPLVFTPR